MSTRFGRRAALVACVGLVLAACTSESSDGGNRTATTAGTAATGAPPGGGTAGGEPGSASAQGITGDTIRVSVIASDLSALSEQNLAPEIGDAVDTLEAVVADLNDRGGVAGRRVELVPHVIAGADAAINPEAGRQACLQATQDDKPFAVIITAAISAETVECSARYAGAITITMDSWPDSYYEEAEGRLFSVATHTAIGRQRAYRAWPSILDGVGELEGRTIGIIRIDRPEQQEAVDEGLVPGLTDLGYEVAATAVLPCPEGSEVAGCQQHDVAIQRMQNAGVDFVFLVAQTLSGSATVESAAKLGFTPQWATIGNNVTDTVARFYTNAKDNYDGAWGIDTVFPEPTDAADRCNEIAVAGGAQEFERGSDGYGFTAVTCLQLQTLADAIELAAEQGTITQASVIAALESFDTLEMSAGPPGSLSAAKHDGGDYVFLSRYDASVEEFVPHDDAAPIAVE
jgi:ABC-type branched-subunit amino acid transport system substrate-binding protein